MKAPDDLVAVFSRGMPARVAQATELWLSVEQGKTRDLAVLRRLLHTIKGEAHMLEQLACSDLAELAESVVAALRKAGEPTPLAGDALLGAFEAMGLVSSQDADDEPPDLEPVRGQLRAALDELERIGAALSGRPMTRSSCPPKSPSGSSPPPTHSVPAHAATLRAEDIRPLVHEMRRLYGERAILDERLREAHRMLRALLVEIDPRQSAEALAERVTKTLGYGLEVDRRLSGIRAEASSNDFAVSLALDALDSTVRRASVVSTESVLNQVRRIVRSTARTLDKEVDLEVRGDAILDAAVAQRLEPALLHLVRNAVDHGIEPADVRRQRGKPVRGRISVSIKQNESSVAVDVSDDGGGIDFDRLRQVLAPRVADVQALTTEDLLPYLFEQGITTSEQVTAISGRGVGLDVVSREVGAAGGQTRIESKPLLGTRVILHMPATLRGELAVPVTSGELRCAVPSRAVFTVIRLGEIQHTADNAWVRVKTDEGPQLVRLFSLGSLLGGNDRPKVGEAALVLYHASGLYAVSVGSYDNPRPITVERSQDLPFHSALVRGVSPTPDGGVLLLLDVEALHAAARGLVSSGAIAKNLAGSSVRRALVVEDAPVARELLSGILRSLGLRVEEATDGRQGLSMARTDPPDLVLTDIEMPYMDGIEMVTHFRASPALARVPVIVLTTAATENNRSRLERLDVVAVLSKQKFVETELRELVDRCLKTRA